MVKERSPSIEVMCSLTFKNAFLIVSLSISLQNQGCFYRLLWRRGGLGNEDVKIFDGVFLSGILS